MTDDVKTVPLHKTSAETEAEIHAFIKSRTRLLDRQLAVIVDLLAEADTRGDGDVCRVLSGILQRKTVERSDARFSAIEEYSNMRKLSR